MLSLEESGEKTFTEEREQFSWVGGIATHSSSFDEEDAQSFPLRILSRVEVNPPLPLAFCIYDSLSSTPWEEALSAEKQAGRVSDRGLAQILSPSYYYKLK